MRRDRCGGCQADTLEVFLDLGKTPLADRFPASADEPEPTFPLEVAVCTSCWLVQLLEVVPDDILWADYGFYSSASPSKVAYHERYAAWTLKEFGEQAKRLTVEIGCNDGDLLRHFQAAGCRVAGIDPAAGPMMQTFAWLLDRYTEPFSRATAERVRGECGPAGLIIANHVAAHVADPHDFFGGIADLLAPDGIALVEVQYLPDLLVGNQFDHVYHEHRFFYSAGALDRIAARHGLRVRSIRHVAAQGGSIRVVLDRDDPSNRIAIDAWPFLAEQRYGLHDMATYAGFQGRVERVRDRLNDLLAGELATARVAGYGATAKSTTLLNYLDASPDLIEYVEDTTPAKIGRVTPGTHIPIVAPGEREPPDVFLVLAWNYIGDIIRREREFVSAGGRFIIPVPIPILI